LSSGTCLKFRKPRKLPFGGIENQTPHFPLSVNNIDELQQISGEAQQISSRSPSINRAAVSPTSKPTTVLNKAKQDMRLLITLALTSLSAINVPLALAHVNTRSTSIVTCSSLTGKACTAGTESSGQCCSTDGSSFNAYVLCNGGSFNGDLPAVCSGANRSCFVQPFNNDFPECCNDLSPNEDCGPT
jgi:hypothetical protein